MESRTPFSTNLGYSTDGGDGNSLVGRTRSLEDTRGGLDDLIALRWEVKEKDSTIQLLHEKYRREIDHLNDVISKLEEEGTSSHFTDKDLAITKLQDELFASFMQHRQVIKEMEDEHAEKMEIVKRNVVSEYSGIVQHLSDEKTKLEAELEKLREMTVDDLEEEEAFHSVDLVRLSGSKDRLDDRANINTNTNRHAAPTTTEINRLRSRQFEERLASALMEQRQILDLEHAKEKKMLVESRSAALSDLREHLERQYLEDLEKAIKLVKSEATRHENDNALLVYQRNIEDMQSKIVREKDEMHLLHRQELEELEAKYKFDLKNQSDEFEQDYKVAMDEVRVKAQAMSSALRAKDEMIALAQQEITSLKNERQSIFDCHKTELDNLHLKLLTINGHCESLKQEMTLRNNDQNSQIDDYKIAVEKLQVRIDEYETTLQKNYDEYLASIQEHKEAHAFDKRMSDAAVKGLTQELQKMEAKNQRDLEDRIQEFASREGRIKAEMNCLADKLGEATALELISKNQITSLRVEVERLHNIVLEKEALCDSARENQKTTSSSLVAIKMDFSLLKTDREGLLSDITYLKKTTEEDLANLRLLMKEVIINNSKTTAAQVQEVKKTIADKLTNEHIVAKAKIVDEMVTSHNLVANALRVELRKQHDECSKLQSSLSSLLAKHIGVFENITLISEKVTRASD